MAHTICHFGFAMSLEMRRLILIFSITLWEIINKNSCFACICQFFCRFAKWRVGSRNILRRVGISFKVFKPLTWCLWLEILYILQILIFQKFRKNRILRLARGIVMGRVYPNPKTRRVFGHFNKPEATRTRTFLEFMNPKVPEPEV